MYTIKDALGERIRSMRKEAKMSQEALALQASLDRTYIASIEKGRRNVSIVNICRLANALDCSLSELFDSEEFTDHSLESMAKVAEKGAKYTTKKTTKKSATKVAKTTKTKAKTTSKKKTK